MEFDEDGEGAVGGAAEQVHLPGRQAPLDGSLHEFGGEPGGLGGEVGAGEGDLADVAAHVEVGVGAPGGAADGDEDVADAHPEPGDGGGAAGEEVQDVGRLLAGRGGQRAEVGEGTEVQGVGGGFQVPEGQVQRGQELGGHGCPHVLRGGVEDRSQSRTDSYGQVRSVNAP